MGVKQVAQVVCDECGVIVHADLFVDATVYGVAFHTECWEKIGGPRVARVLYLDDIFIKNREGAVVRRAMGD